MRVRARRRGLVPSDASITSGTDTTSPHHSSSTGDHLLSPLSTTAASITPIQYPLRPHSVSTAIQRGRKEVAGSSSGSSLGGDEVFIDRPRFSQTAPLHTVADKPVVAFLSPHTLPSTSHSTNSPDGLLNHKRQQQLVFKNRVSPLSINIPRESRTPSPPRQTRHSHRNSSGSPSGVFSLTPSSSPLPSLLTTQLRKGGTLPSVETDWECDGVAVLEGILPDRELTVFVGTWNMHERKVSLPLDLSVPDLQLCDTTLHTGAAPVSR